MADNSNPWDFERNYQQRQTDISEMQTRRLENAFKAQAMQRQAQEQNALRQVFRGASQADFTAEKSYSRAAEIAARFGDIEMFTDASTKAEELKKKRVDLQKEQQEVQQKERAPIYQKALAFSDKSVPVGDDDLATVRADVEEKFGKNSLEYRMLPVTMKDPQARTKLQAVGKMGESMKLQTDAEKYQNDVSLKWAKFQEQQIEDARRDEARKAGVQKKESDTAIKLNRDAAKERAPIDDAMSKIQRVRDLLKTDDPATTPQITTLLTNIFDKTRATNMLFTANKNFGNIYERVAGFLAKGIAGKYSEAQRKQIREMLDNMEQDVLAPEQAKIKKRYMTEARAYGIPDDMIQVDSVYASDDEPSDADRKAAEAYLSRKKK